jgi:uncharacterized protein YbaR (Trm112 family)
VRTRFARQLRCPFCQGDPRLEVFAGSAGALAEGALACACGPKGPVIAGVPRLLPAATSGTLVSSHPDFFARYPDLMPRGAVTAPHASIRTLHAFGDEWQRFPELLEVHQRIFDWYFEGPQPIRWKGLRVLDVGCGMGRWLHFAREAGAEVVGMDVSPAIDVAAARDGDGADFVQADLRWPPFPPESFDLVCSLGGLRDVGFEVVAILPGLGWRAIGRRAPSGEIPDAAL